MTSLSIRQILRLDAVITGATALLMLAGAAPLGDLLDLPTALLAVAGAVLVPYIGYLLWLASRDPAPRAGVLLTVGANIAWAIGCVALLLSGQVDPNGLGIAFVLINIVAVLAFADLQVLALRGDRAGDQQRAFSLEV